ncbi:class I SAM-dependent methyltransferase [Neolewinella persica]|uniref:class I SAM-dependent methyltransferase n=1 Tax=Neolewinella persica TaxID=70998 RepID=UPI000366D85A|nr:methyltransferase domain-containing protein [Neolewinella persica]
MAKYTIRWRVAQYLERRWWRRYLKGKSPEDYLADKRSYWAKTLDQLDWEPVAGRRVLDAGCGPAGVFILVHELEKVTALDPLLHSYEKDLSVFKQVDYPGVQFWQQPLERGLPEEETFDAIYCFNAINHVDDWGKALDALTAHAHPGTRMVLTSDVHRHQFLLPIFRALPGDALHPQQHGPEAYRAALKARGWRVEWEEVLRREAIFDYTAWVAVLED